MARDEQQAMSAERLEQLEQMAFAFGDWQPARALINGIHELLAEVERLLAAIDAKEAREAALVDMLQRLIRDADATYVDVHPYAGIGHTKIVGPFPSTLEQARALLASAEGSGGDGA